MEVLTFAGLPDRALPRAADPRARRPLPRRPRHRPRRRRPHPQSRLDARRAARRSSPACAPSARPILHYKICSTLDSAPHVGSIGAAAEIGLADGGIAPLVVAAPRIGRWQAFGTLFARAGDGIHRLDRHPTMAVPPGHPDGRGRRPPPPRPPDLARPRPDRPRRPQGRPRPRPPRRGARARHSHRGARRDRRRDPRRRGRPDLDGAPGLRHRLPGRRVRARRRLARRRPPCRRPEPAKPLAPVERLAVVSGSCSPITADADRARRGRRLRGHRPRPPRSRLDRRRRQRRSPRSREGRSPLVATARGASDPGVADGAALGAGLGRLLDRLVREAGLTRAVIAGGDTSSHAARALGLVALTAEAPVAHGAALLRGHRGRRHHARDRAEGRPDGAARLLRPSAGRPGNRRRNSRRMRRKA